MKYDYFLGIDPGVAGGIALIDTEDPIETTSVWAMPKTERDIWEVIRQAGKENIFCVIEKVGGFVAGNPAPGSAMWKFGKSYGLLIGFLIAAEVPFQEVIPRVWQKEFGIGTRGTTETKSQFKNRLKSCAQKLHPGIAITLATCDAVLIATYAMRKYGKGV